MADLADVRRVRLRLARVNVPGLEEFLLDAWAMCAPRKVAAEVRDRL